jgi:hypothetical protein
VVCKGQAGKQADRVRVRGCLPTCLPAYLYGCRGLRAGCRSYFSPVGGMGEVVTPGRGWWSVDGPLAGLLAGSLGRWAGDSALWEGCGCVFVCLLLSLEEVVVMVLLPWFGPRGYAW